VPLYPFPDVPIAPGVPALVRSAVTSQPVNIVLGVTGAALLGALQSQQQWGIYDSDNNQLGGVDGLSLVESLVSQPTILSTVDVAYTRETRSANFPVEEGSFASYNKVQTPASPVVTLALTGSSSDRTAFLNALEAACISTDLYSVVTPEVQYIGYSLDRFSYKRAAGKGATLIVVEIALEEIRQVSASYTTAATPVVSPVNPAATTQTNAGNVQASAPDQSTLQSMYTKFSGLMGVQ
jgi:hypothetical protein